MNKRPPQSDLPVFRSLEPGGFLSPFGFCPCCGKPGRQFGSRKGLVFMKIMVSACLTGAKVKYSGGSNYSEALLTFVRGHDVIPVCPEVLGGLPVPREPAEIVNGIVTDRTGRSVDSAFRRGAAAVLKIAEEEKPDLIVLQARSPSCGVREVYDGSFSGKKIPGTGVTAKLLLEHGFRVIDIGELSLYRNAEDAVSLVSLT